MKLENQVCSLELAKKLKELGVKQESLFYYSDWGDENDYEIHQGFYLEEVLNSDDTGNPKPRYSAFTVAELGEMFPGNDGECYFETQKGLLGNMWYCSRRRMISRMLKRKFEAETEADARAKMLIYLIENKLI